MIRSHHARVLEKLVAEHMQQITNSMAVGVDKKTYWRLVGQLAGLTVALQLSEQADQDGE